MTIIIELVSENAMKPKKDEILLCECDECGACVVSREDEQNRKDK